MENVILKTLVCLDLKLPATDAPPPAYNTTVDTWMIQIALKLLSCQRFICASCLRQK